MCAPDLASEPAPKRGAVGESGRKRLTFKLEQRIRTAATFRLAFDGSPPLIGRFMVLRVLRGDAACVRLGIVTSRRTFRRAVERSRARRLLREAFRLNQHRWQAGSEMIMIGRRSILDVGTAAVEVEMRRLMERAGCSMRTVRPPKERT